jgi:hypothetical protein
MNDPNYTIVDTYGRVIRHGSGGVLIQPENDGKPADPVIEISEVSDNEALNFFLYIPQQAGVMKSEYTPDIAGVQVYEILMHRASPRLP